MIVPCSSSWPLNFKYPQLGDTIKLDQIWRQNHDLHWILHPKTHHKFLGVSYFYWGHAPKTLTFSGSDPERLERGPQYSARRRNFQESPRTIVVMRLVYNPSKRKCTSFQYPRCLNQKTKRGPFLPISAPFSTKWLGHRGSPAYPPVQTQNWNSTRGFWIFFPWAEI